LDLFEDVWVVLSYLFLNREKWSDDVGRAHNFQDALAIFANDPDWLTYQFGEHWEFLVLQLPPGDWPRAWHTQSTPEV
jgi:hypothetical protein